MQKVMIIGYLGRNPELKYSSQSQWLRSFPSPVPSAGKTKMANSRNVQSGLPLRRLAGELKSWANSSTKAAAVYLEGRKRTESWDDKKTGGKNYRDLVYVDRLEFLDSRARVNGNHRPEETNDEQSTVPDEEI